MKKKQLYGSFKNPIEWFRSSVVLFYNYNDEGKLIEIKSKKYGILYKSWKTINSFYWKCCIYYNTQRKTKLIRIILLRLPQFLKCSFIHPDNQSPILNIILKNVVDDNMFLFTLSSSLLWWFFPKITEKICIKIV